MVTTHDTALGSDNIGYRTTIGGNNNNKNTLSHLEHSIEANNNNLTSIIGTNNNSTLVYLEHTLN